MTVARAWAARVDPVAVACCLVALCVYLLHGFSGELKRDLGVYSYAGQRVADGLPPYVGILNRAGPLAHLIPGVGAFAARTVGADEVIGMRVLFMLLSLAAVLVAYLLGRDVFLSRAAGVASAASLLCFEGFIEYATHGPREKTAMVLFLLGALLAVVHRRWGTAGFLIALATLTWQPAFFALLPCAVVAVLLGEPVDRRRSLTRIALGGLAPTVVTVAAYTAVGHLQVFLDDFVLINARYTIQSSFLLDDPSLFWRSMSDGYGWSLWVVFAGSLALVASAVVALRDQASRRSAPTAALVGIAVTQVVAVAWSLRAFNGWPDAFLLLPGAAVGIGGITVAVARRASARTVATLTGVWATAAVALALVFSVGERDDGLDQQRADVDAVVGALPPGARIFSVDAPQAMVLSGQVQPVRHQLFTGGLDDYIDDTWPGGLDGYGRWIGRQGPTVIAMGLEGVPAWLQPVIDEGYSRVGRTTGWTWFVRRDVDAGAREELRTRLAPHRED